MPNSWPVLLALRWVYGGFMPLCRQGVFEFDAYWALDPLVSLPACWFGRMTVS